MSFPTTCDQFLHCRGLLVDLSSPVVMGVINTTPDSFYAGSRHTQANHAVNTAGKMLEEGATILDIGGYSSRPGAAPVSEEEELERVLGAVQAIHKVFPETAISVDTFRSEVAIRALDAGAGILNDITAGEDERLLKVAAEYHAPLILMHKKGKPADMQEKPLYENVVREVFDYLAEKMILARKAGVTDIILDPGFGFGKNLTHNYTLAKHTDLFRMIGVPLLAGISRKSMIQKIVGVEAAEALNGTTALHMQLLLAGANILRVHDVKAARETIKLFNQLQQMP